MMHESKSSPAFRIETGPGGNRSIVREDDDGPDELTADILNDARLELLEVVESLRRIVALNREALEHMERGWQLQSAAQACAGDAGVEIAQLIGKLRSLQASYIEFATEDLRSPLEKRLERAEMIADRQRDEEAEGARHD